MALYTIADLHLSFGSEKPMDVFSGWDNYVDRLKKNWESKVKERDVVVIAGDVSWAMKLEEAKKDFLFIDSLPGKKIIIKGNHDYWWSTVKKIEKFLEDIGCKTISVLQNSAVRYKNYCICGTRGWLCNSESDEDKKILLREVGRLNKSIDVAEKNKLIPIVFLHYPPVYKGEECKEIMDILIARNVKKCYYGHVHGNRAVKRVVTGEYKGIEFNLISCDYINFSPVLVEY